MKEVKETVTILVKAKIQYDQDDPETRKEAINYACENSTGINTWGYPVSVELVSAKEQKKRKRKRTKK